MDLCNSQSLLYYKQINTTIPQTNIISTIKQLINAVSQFLQTCKRERQTDRQRDGQTDRQRELVFEE